MNRLILDWLICLSAVMLMLAACKKDAPPNPFDDPSLKPPNDSTTQVNLDPNSFAGIHFNILAKTCANSGCHDGTFEPDYRTIESSYNTLVYHPVIKNNPSGDFTYRVEPYNVNGSVLHERITKDIDGISGIMPLQVDPDSDWPSKKSQYIQNIVTWIQNGARDMFGNLPSMGNKEPQMLGVAGFQGGNLLPRKPGNGAIRVQDGGTSVDIWVAFSDDSTAVPSLSYNKYKIDTTRDNFSALPEFPMTVAGSPVTEDGYFGAPVSYYHKFTIPNPGSFGPVGTVVFFRTYVQDPQHDVTEIPENGSFNYIKDYFSFELE